MNLFMDFRDSGVFLDVDPFLKECLKFCFMPNSTLLQNCGISRNKELTITHGCSRRKARRNILCA